MYGEKILTSREETSKKDTLIKINKYIKNLAFKIKYTLKDIEISIDDLIKNKLFQDFMIDKTKIYEKVYKAFLAKTKGLEKAKDVLDNLLVYSVKILILASVILILHITSLSIRLVMKKAILKNNDSLDKVYIKDIENIPYMKDDIRVKLKATISSNDENIQKDVEILMPKEIPKDYEVVDKILKNQTKEKIKKNNKSLKEVTDDLDLSVDSNYDVSVLWESKKGYIDTSTGKVLRSPKGGGVKNDTLTLTVSYNDIKKVKTFKISILELDKTKDEINVKNAEKKLDELIKKNQIFENSLEKNFENREPILNSKSKLIENIDGAQIRWNKESNNEKNDSDNKASQMITLIVIVLLSSIYFRYVGIKEKASQKVKTLEDEFPNFIEEYILLAKAGYNLAKTIEYIAGENKDSKSPLDIEIKKIANNVKNGLYIYIALDEFTKRSGSMFIKKFMLNLVSNIKRGNKSINEFLKKELDLAYVERKSRFEKTAQENSVKMLLPMMLILIATMIIVVYPAIIALEL